MDTKSIVLEEISEKEFRKIAKALNIPSRTDILWYKGLLPQGEQDIVTVY